MKRIISTFLISIIFAISCISSTMADFSVSKVEMDTNMNHEMMNSSDCCESMSGWCNEIGHECCISPFKDWANISWNTICQKQEKKLKIISLDILAIIQEWLKSNYSERLTSPPNDNNLEKECNTYITLIGIIKNNC